jgi:hypothetical protein
MIFNIRQVNMCVGANIHNSPFVSCDRIKAIRVRRCVFMIAESIDETYGRKYVRSKLRCFIREDVKRFYLFDVGVYSSS